MGHARDERYAPRSQDDVVALLREQPMGWLVSAGDDGHATPLPLRAELDAQGRLVALCGHLARRNPQVETLRSDPRARAFVLGPNAYVSASWLDDRTQAPTWNYVALAFTLRVSLAESPAAIASELDALVAQVEAARPRAWRIAEMGERYARLAQGVVAFRAEIVELRATFKLGQDERAHDFAQILAGLDAAGETALTRWMRAFDERGPEDGKEAP